MHGIPRHGISLPRASLGSEDSKDVDGRGNGQQDLVFVHVPYNFGHTVEKVMTFGHGLTARPLFAVLYVSYGDTSQHDWERKVEKMTGKDKELWGMVNPLLHGTSSIGCPMYLTPPKHLPAQIADEYLGNRTSFGMLRDPYERLVSIFRGSVGGQTGKGYGGDYSKYAEDCDVDSAVQDMLAKVQKDPFAEGCALLPQAEYFDGDRSIQIPVDNRKFPMSTNSLLQEHGYGEEVIRQHDIEHVTGCWNIWSATLSPSTRALVRKVYKRDFELLCEHFNYCDDDETTCLQHVEGMCPKNMTKV